MKRPGALLLPPVWDASQKQGYPDRYLKRFSNKWIASAHLYIWEKENNAY